MTSLEVQDASSKLAMRSVTDEDDENLPPEIPCQSQGCARIFHSEFEMREHMTKDDHRSYCFKCKLDFNGPASLFVHKVTSKKHFTCPLCKIDFHSAGGRDRHIQSVSPSRALYSYLVSYSFQSLTPPEPSPRPKNRLHRLCQCLQNSLSPHQAHRVEPMPRDPHLPHAPGATPPRTNCQHPPRARNVRPHARLLRAASPIHSMDTGSRG